MELTFRKAKKEELYEIMELYHAGVNNMLESGIKQWDEQYPNIEVISADIERGELNLCICDGKIAAAYAVNCVVEPDYDNADWQYPEARWCAMHRLCVSPDFHRRGIGTAVMKNIEADAKMQGFDAVHLDTFSGNHRALELYRKLGYKEVGEAHWTRGRFVIFEKKIDL